MRQVITAKPSGSSTWNAHTGTPSVMLRPASRSSRTRSMPARASRPATAAPTNPAKRLGGDRHRPGGQQRAGGQRQQPVVAGGQRAAEQRHDQREVLDERRAAGNARVEAPQHDLGDRQQRQQRQRQHRQRVLEPLQRAVVVDAPRFGGGVGVEGHLAPRLLRNASRSRMALVVDVGRHDRARASTRRTCRPCRGSPWRRPHRASSP